MANQILYAGHNMLNAGQYYICIEGGKYLHSDGTIRDMTVPAHTGFYKTEAEAEFTLIVWERSLKKKEDNEMTKLDPIKEAYITLQKATGFKVGDRVKVVRKAKNHESGWLNFWMPTMDHFVGETGTIVAITDDRGIMVGFSHERDRYWFPFFCLELAEARSFSVKLNDEYTAKVYKNKIIVGCQTFDMGVILSLIGDYKAQKHNLDNYEG